MLLLDWIGKHMKTHSTALGTALCILLLIAGDADHMLVTWYETLAADRLPTFLAAKALLVPLLAHVLKFLHSYHKHSHSALL